MLYLLSYSYLIKVFGCPIISSFFAEATAPSFANNGLKFLLKLFPLSGSEILDHALTYLFDMVFAQMSFDCSFNLPPYVPIVRNNTLEPCFLLWLLFYSTNSYKYYIQKLHLLIQFVFVLQYCIVMRSVVQLFLFTAEATAPS